MKSPPSRLLATATLVTLAMTAQGCSKSPASPDVGASAPKSSSSASSAPSPPRAPDGPLPPNATACASTPSADGGAAPRCLRFVTADDAFRHVLSKNPLILAVGESHAQKGTEAIASSTKRFTESFLPIVAPRSTDIVVELWAPDPKCMKEVKVVASAQKPVTDVQAKTNQNEYVVLGTKAKDAGMTPWLLRPTCDDFSMLADAGADTVGASLGLIKRLTQAKLGQLYERNQKSTSAAPDGGLRASERAVVAYGGALHNDLAPSEAMKEFTFGPELDRLTQGRYVELDLIVPEYVKKSATWEKLPWFASFEAERASAKPIDQATLYVISDKSYVLVFPSTPGAAPAAP